MVVNWIGHLDAKDFAFLAGRKGDGTLDAEPSPSSGSFVSECTDVFWPKLQEFVSALDLLHLVGEITKREDVRHLRGDQVQRALAKLKPQVAFVFRYEGRIKVDQ